MGKMIKAEFQKLMFSKLFWLTIIIGCGLAVMQAYLNLIYVRTVVENSAAMIHPSGMSSIALIVRWLGADVYTVVGTLFSLILPLLAAIPYGASYYRERKSGYAMQMCTRVGDRAYLFGKWLVTFLSGMIVIAVPLILNFMINALFSPLTTVHILSLQSPVAQGSFCSELFYQNPLVYIFVSVLLTATWGGICAAMSMMFAMFMKNAVLILAAPMASLVILHFMAIYSKQLFSYTNYEMSPLNLMSAACFNPNPTGFVICYVLVFVLITLFVSWKWGIKRECL